MNTFARLKTGEIMVVWSDNTTDETMNLYPLSCMPFDPEVHTTKVYPYSAIAETDTNLAVLQHHLLTLPTVCDRVHLMKIPLILSTLKQQQANLKACIASTSECMEIHKGNVAEQLRLARSMLNTKENLDRIEEQIRYIEIALSQLKNGITAESR